MNFFIGWDLKFSYGSLEIKTWNHNPSEKLSAGVLHLIKGQSAASYRVYPYDQRFFCIIGDPVFHDVNASLTYLEKNDMGSFIRSVDGFYYLICWDKNERSVLISSGMFGILPVFYMNDGEGILISSSLELIRENTTRSLTPDEQFLLEKALFNYSFLDRTPVEQIKLLPANHFLKLTNKLHIVRHTDLTDYFVTNPIPLKKSLDHISDLFIQQAKPFIPEDSFVATLTGGFDGRTITGISLWLQRTFHTYSYGSPGSSDILIPQKISSLTGVPHHALILDHHYATNHFLKYGEKFVLGTNGFGNLTRAHYSYATDEFLKDYKYLVSGNFGSENFRSMHLHGVMATGVLYSIFREGNAGRFAREMDNYPGITYLSDRVVKRYRETTIQSVEGYVKQLPTELTENQKFYIYLYEHVFPKYFGPEIVYQWRRLVHRAPYLSFGFISEMLKTGIAGANQKFLEKNPLHRYRGQVIYAHILKKTYPMFLDIPLDRGYKPADFLSYHGYFRIALGYSRKKLHRKFQKELADYSVNQVILNIHKLKEISIDPEYFNLAVFSHMFERPVQDKLMYFTNMLSAAIYLNYLLNGKIITV